MAGLSRPSTPFLRGQDKTWMPRHRGHDRREDNANVQEIARIHGPCRSSYCSAASAHALTPEEIVNYRGADREQVLIDGAKKEGQVVLYSALIVNQMLRPLTAGFMKKYPFIKMTYYRADSEELLPKLSAETRANNVVADVFEGSGGGEIAVEAGLTQPSTRRRSTAIRKCISTRRATWRRRGSPISASPTTPSRCRPTRCRRPTRTCSIRNGRARWRGPMPIRAVISS